MSNAPSSGPRVESSPSFRSMALAVLLSLPGCAGRMAQTPVSDVDASKDKFSFYNWEARDRAAKTLAMTQPQAPKNKPSIALSQLIQAPSSTSQNPPQALETQATILNTPLQIQPSLGLQQPVAAHLNAVQTQTPLTDEEVPPNSQSAIDTPTVAAPILAVSEAPQDSPKKPIEIVLEKMEKHKAFDEKDIAVIATTYKQCLATKPFPTEAESKPSRKMNIINRQLKEAQKNKKRCDDLNGRFLDYRMTLVDLKMNAGELFHPVDIEAIEENYGRCLSLVPFPQEHEPDVRHESIHAKWANRHAAATVNGANCTLIQRKYTIYHRDSLPNQKNENK